MRQFIIVLSILFSSFALAQVDIKAGDFLSLDVADQDAIVSFSYIIHTDNDEALKFKVSNFNDFECRIFHSQLVSRIEKPSAPAILKYDFSIHWQPGADLSSCQVQVRHSDARQDAIVELKMNY